MRYTFRPYSDLDPTGGIWTDRAFFLKQMVNIENDKTYIYNAKILSN